VKKTETMWAIYCMPDPIYTSFPGFLYVGTFTTKRGMIYIHSNEKSQSWRECRKEGDRCVKVRVTYEVPEK
jgi:hypothetical protein